MYQSIYFFIEQAIHTTTYAIPAARRSSISARLRPSPLTYGDEEGGGGYTKGRECLRGSRRVLGTIEKYVRFRFSCVSKFKLFYFMDSSITLTGSVPPRRGSERSTPPSIHLSV